MQFKKLTAFLSLATLSAALCLIAEQPPALAKTKKHVQHHSGSYLVPPPPAYMPSILPERGYSYGSQSSSYAGGAYGKYIYTRNGYSTPEPIHPNKYVTYWNQG